ncbi:MAG: cell division protein FtsQ/DivIB [Planctomycetota bacterium]
MLAGLSGGIDHRVTRSDPRRPRLRRRAGQVPFWIPFALIASILAALSAALEGDLDLVGFTRIDPRRTTIADSSGLVDARWRETLAARLASLPPFSSIDPSAGPAIRAALLSLPFVAEVGEGRVLWPDGYDVRVRFREPVACVLVGDVYLAVSKEGVILPGEWVRPPWIGGGWLPLLAADEGALDRVRSEVHRGARLVAPEFADALDVATSMRASLSAEDFETMGAPAIDASHARRASVEDPGVVLHLEGGRRVFFGRIPGSDEPGELPASKKWDALRRGLKAIRNTSADARDWVLLDVRWDVPDVLWRDGEPAAVHED